MTPAHNNMENVRKYLLGTLTDRDAAAIEEQSFLNKKAFDEIEVAERVLIEDYLAGRLTPDERAAFEAKYLHVPFLRKKLEAVRNEGPLFGPKLILRIAGALTVLTIAFAALWRTQHGKSTSSLSTVTHPAHHATVILNLAPILKKDGGVAPQITLPAPDTQLVIQAELATLAAESNYPAHLYRLEQDSRQEVWHGNAQPSADKRQAIMTLDASVLRLGDYLLELEVQGGKSQEDYFFTVIVK